MGQPAPASLITSAMTQRKNATKPEPRQAPNPHSKRQAHKAAAAGKVLFDLLDGGFFDGLERGTPDVGPKPRPTPEPISAVPVPPKGDWWGKALDVGLAVLKLWR